MLSDASSFGRPLHEPYLRHQLRLHPLHLPHLASRSADQRVYWSLRGDA